MALSRLSLKKSVKPLKVVLDALLEHNIHKQSGYIKTDRCQLGCGEDKTRELVVYW